MAKVVVGATLNVDGAQAQKTVKEFKQELQSANKELKTAEKELDDVVQKFGELSPEAKEAAQKLDQIKNKISDIGEGLDGATEAAKSFKTKLKEATADLLNMSEKFGEFSPQAIEAAKRVAELKDGIGDAQSLVDTFNPDAKFVAFGQSVQGVVGGFTALQGVMGLVGVESEEVEQALLKVQSALAISEGVDQILNSVQGFKNLGAVIQQSTAFMKLNEVANKAAAFSMKLFGVSVETTSTSFRVLKGAIAATGIGLLLVLVGEAISLFDDLASAAKKAAEREKEALEINTKLADADLETQLARSDREEKRQEARLKKQGASEAEFLKNQQFWQVQRISSLERYINQEQTTEAARDQAKQKLQEAKNQLLQNRLDYEAAVAQKARDEQKKKEEKADQEAKARADKAAADAKARAEAAKKLNEELHSENEVNAAGGGRDSEIIKLLQEFDEKAKILKAGGQSLLELDIWFNEQKKAIDQKYREEEQARQIAAVDAQIAREKEAAEQKAAAHQAYFDAIRDAAGLVVEMEGTSIESRKRLIDEGEANILASTQFSEEEKLVLLKAFSDARKEIDTKEHQAKQELQQQEAALLDVASELAGRQTALGKGLAIASTTISTYSAAQKAYESQMITKTPDAPVRAVIAAAVAVAQGLVKVKSIMKVQIPGKGGGGGAGVSVPSVSTAAPLQSQLTTNQTQLNQQSINALGNQAIRTYMVESDVTSDQEKIRRLNRAARL